MIRLKEISLYDGKVFIGMYGGGFFKLILHYFYCTVENLNVTNFSPQTKYFVIKSSK